MEKKDEKKQDTGDKKIICINESCSEFLKNLNSIIGYLNQFIQFYEEVIVKKNNDVSKIKSLLIEYFRCVYMFSVLKISFKIHYAYNKEVFDNDDLQDKMDEIEKSLDVASIIEDFIRTLNDTYPCKNQIINNIEELIGYRSDQTEDFYEERKKERTQRKNIKSLEKNFPKYGSFKLLGGGVYGVVYSCVNIESGKKSAIKIIDKSDNEKKEISIPTEVKNLQKLECSRYVLCYLDFKEDEKNYYIVTELLEGYITLEKFIEGVDSKYNTIYYKWIVPILINQLIISIDSIHKSNIAHSDLHQGNIMINPKTLHLKIIDFGESCFNGECEDGFEEKKNKDLKTIGNLMFAILSKNNDSEGEEKVNVTKYNLSLESDGNYYIDIKEIDKAISEERKQEIFEAIVPFSYPEKNLEHKEITVSKWIPKDVYNVWKEP